MHQLDIYRFSEGQIRPMMAHSGIVDIKRLEIISLIDPLTVAAEVVVDATGHATEVVKVVAKKVPGDLLTPHGKD